MGPVPTDTELTNMLREIASTQAKLYYKAEEKNPPVIVVRSVFMLIVAAVTIAFTRAGVTEDRLNNLEGIPDEIAQEMKAVGWKLDELALYVNTD